MTGHCLVYNSIHFTNLSARGPLSKVLDIHKPPILNSPLNFCVAEAIGKDFIQIWRKANFNLFKIYNEKYFKIKKRLLISTYIYVWKVTPKKGKIVCCKLLDCFFLMLSLSTPYCLLDPCCSLLFSRLILCSKSKKCSKNNHHKGKCDRSREFHEFWQKSTVYQLKNQQCQLSRAAEDVQAKKSEIEIAKQQLAGKQDEIKSLVAVAEAKIAVASKLHLCLCLLTGIPKLMLAQTTQ